MDPLARRVSERFLRAAGHSLPGVVDDDDDMISWTLELDSMPGVMRWGTFLSESEHAVKMVEGTCGEVADKLGRGLGIRTALMQTRCTVDKTGKFSVTAAMRYIASDDEGLMDSKDRVDWFTQRLPGYTFTGK